MAKPVLPKLVRSSKRKKSDGDYDDEDFKNSILEKLDYMQQELDVANLNIKTVMNENAIIKAELMSIKKSSDLSKSVVRGGSYADKVKGSGPVVLIAPKDSNQNSEKTKEVVKEKINPVENQVNGIRRAAKGAVIVECKDKNSSEQLKSCVVKSLGDKYDVNLPKRRKPKFKICGMSERLTDDQLIEYMIKQNESIKAENDLKVLKTIETVDKFKNKKYQAIMEADDDNYKKIINMDRIFVNWDSCKVMEHLNVIRCFKCFGFNHFSKDCTKDVTCKFCAGNHDSSTCKSASHKCVNCMYYVEKFKMQLDVNHHAYSIDCKVLQRKYDDEKKKVQLSE